MTKRVQRTRCNGCGNLYLKDLPGGTAEKPKIGVCPEAICTAKREWDPDRWEGAARMADARAHAGVALNATDEIALQRK